MMELNDIVTALSSNLRPGEGTLVLHRSMIVHPKFRVCKKFRYDLYLIDRDKNRKCVLTHTEDRSVTADDIERVWEECNKLYLKVILGWVASDGYRKLIDHGAE